MSLLRRLGFSALVVVCCPWSASQARLFIGVGLGGPGYYRPYYGYGGYGYGYGYGGYGYGYGYGRPYGVYLAPPPVIVQPGPVVVQQPTVVQPAYPPSAYAPPAQPPAPLPPPNPVTSAGSSAPDVMPAVATGGSSDRQADVDAYVRQLRTGDEQARADALVRLGRLQDERAVGPMVKALNSDGSPKVREAAARGLGLIGSRSRLERLAVRRAGRRRPRSASQRQLCRRGHPRQPPQVKV